MGAKQAPEEPSASSASPNKSAATKPGRYFDEGKGLLGEEGKDWISEEVEAAGGGLDWGGEGDEPGEEAGREGDQSIQGDTSLDGGRRIRTPSQETLQKIRWPSMRVVLRCTHVVELPVLCLSGYTECLDAARLSCKCVWPSTRISAQLTDCTHVSGKLQMRLKQRLACKSHWKTNTSKLLAALAPSRAHPRAFTTEFD